MTLLQIARRIADRDVLAVCDLSQLAELAAGDGYTASEVRSWALSVHNDGVVTLMRDPAPHLRSASERAAWVELDGVSFSGLTFEVTTHGQEGSREINDCAWLRSIFERDYR
jgi:hypothetical protein